MEQWKDIPGFEHLYEASTLGRIRTCEGKTTQSARFEHRVWKQRIMKPKFQTRSNGRRDARVELWKDGTHKTYLIARLVAITWCDGYNEGMTVNHIDGNSLNNNANNLEWCSLKENIQKGFETGLFRCNQIPVALKAPNGEIKTFNSFAEASRYLGKGNSYLSTCLARGKRYTPDGYDIITKNVSFHEQRH